jgi:hypothetical protein
MCKQHAESELGNIWSQMKKKELTVLLQGAELVAVQLVQVCI